MKNYLLPFLPKGRLFFGNFLVGFLISMTVQAQLPTAQTIASQMTVGWNLGNTMEAICGETAWGGAVTSQQLIDSVKAAGFNTVRIPCAWDCHTSNGVIDPAWIARVKQIVDYCVNDNLYVILNIHWDGGWLENNVTVSAQASVNAKQKNYWTQIANYFKGYNEHLLFASANEPNVNDATGMSVLLSYHQTFVNAVRATGGNNGSRTLIIQGPSADINLTNSLMNTLPADPISRRMIVEVHYYTPFQYCLMGQDASWGNMFYYWGNGYHSTTDVTRNATWGEEAYLDSSFALMKSKFVDKGIPVIIGEFAVGKRNLSPPSDEALHLASRLYYYRYLVSSAKSKGIIPLCWDTNMGLFNRSTATALDQDVINAINQGAGNAYISLTNHASGLLIDGMYRSTNGSTAGQWSNSGSDAQRWLMETAGSYIRLKNKATGLYLDGMYSYTNGAAAGQWSNSGSDAQLWSIQPAGSYLKISNKATGLYLDGMYRYSNGSDLGQWSNSGSDAQLWTSSTVGHVQTANSAAALSTVPIVRQLDQQTRDKALLYPNPFTSTFNMTFDNPDEVNQIEIFDIGGKQVEIIGRSMVLKQMAIGAALKSGVYIVKVHGTSWLKEFKVVKLQ